MDVKLLDLRAQYASIRDDVRAAIDRICDSQSLVLGQAVSDFEARLAKYCQTEHAIGLSNGSDAIIAALMALEIGPGDEVICPPFTFFSTAGSVARVGATPVFCDIDPETFNLDPARLEPLITARTKVIMPVHLFGQCADMTRINEIACRHEVKVIEDAAQAIGARHHDRPATSMGWMGALSFYPTKNLGAFGDAGAVCCNDDEMAERLRKIRVHGSGHTYYHEMIGGNFRIDALQAAILDVKLRHLESWHEGRRRNAAIYDEMLAESDVVTPAIRPENRSVYNQYTVRVTGGRRDAVRQALADAGIGSAVYYPLCLHEQQCFAYPGHSRGDFPESERAADEVLSLPIYPELSEAEVRHVATTLAAITAKTPAAAST